MGKTDISIGDLGWQASIQLQLIVGKKIQIAQLVTMDTTATHFTSLLRMLLFSICVAMPCPGVSLVVLTQIIFLSLAPFLWTSGQAQVQCVRTARISGYLQQQKRGYSLSKLCVSVCPHSVKPK